MAIEKKKQAHGCKEIFRQKLYLTYSEITNRNNKYSLD